MRIVLPCLGFGALLGVCLGTAAVRAQITNPTYAILTLEHYQAYYAFSMLGEQLDSLARLGALAAALIITSFVLWAAGVCGLTRYINFSRQGEQFSLPWDALSVCSMVCLGLIWQVGWLAALAADLRNHPFTVGHGLFLSGLVLVPALLLRGLRAQVREHRVLRWPLGGLLLTGTSLALMAFNLIQQLAENEFLVPPMLSTHYGPWGVMGWNVTCCACLGLACGVLMLGLAPEAEAEPDTLQPTPPGNRYKALALGCLFSVVLVASYPLYLQPRYQVGQSLLDACPDLNPDLPIPGRTVVWLDGLDPAHHLPEQRGWPAQPNLDLIQRWITESPTPSALTRPAAKLLGNEALWQWRPAAALDWLEVHRRRQSYSNLNRVFLAALASSKPDPKLFHHLEALTNRDRFAWPGPGSRLELAAQLRRYGHDQEAAQWEEEAQTLGADLLSPNSSPLPGGSISGRLTLDGEPLVGARVALFYGRDSEELRARTRQHVEGEAELVSTQLTPGYYQYIDFQRLLNFYAVDITDSEGRFLFEDAEPGLYRLGVRLARPAELAQSGQMAELQPGEELDLGTFKLISPVGYSKLP